MAACALVIGTFGLAPQSASAYRIFFGEDLNSNGYKVLKETPNASAAEKEFLSILSGVGTEDFEDFKSGSQKKLKLEFPSAGKAKLTGGNGYVASVKPGSSNGVGRYGTSGSNFFEVSAGGKGNFVVDFSKSVAAFGFYGIDIGDFGGQLQIQLNDVANTLLTVTNTIGKYGSTDGSVLFFGVVAETGKEEFTQASFLTTTSQGDVFAFDDMTVGSRQQVLPPVDLDPQVIPEPPTLAMLGLGIAGLTVLRRIRRT